MDARRLGLLVAMGCALGCHSGGRPGKADAAIIPALEADVDQDLTFAIETTPTADRSGRRIRLLPAGGEATLTLYDPTSAKGVEVAFGRGELAATDRGRGGGLVAAVARWLGQPVPPQPKTLGELQPFRLSYARLGTQEGWECNKLFFEEGSLEAEVFLNIRADGKQARFVEKDEEYRQPLLGLLALALRDGRPPRPKTGPDAVAPGSLVASLSQIAGSKGVREPEVWVGGLWIATLESGPHEKILGWKDLEREPRTLAEVSGPVSTLTPSPRKDRVALVVLRPKDPNAVSSEDPGDLLIMPVDGGAPRPLVVGSNDFSPGMVSRLAWSADGARLAIDGRVSDKAPHATQTRVYEVASGRLLGRTSAGVPGPAPRRWEGDTLILETSNEAGEQSVRWQPAKGPPGPARADSAGAVRAPDGRYTVAFRGTGIDISGPGGHHRFEAKDESDRAAVAALREDPDLVSWLGTASLVLESEAPMVLDLATARLRYLLPPQGDLQFVSASDDGGRVVARDRNLQFYWGRVAR